MKHYRMRRAAMAAVATFLFAGLLYADIPDIRVGAFSGTRPGRKLPPRWKPWILKNVKRRTAYALAADEDDVTAVKANADDSASGLMNDLTVDPREYPVLQWRWKVANIIEGADVAKKGDNDSPARIYVAFTYDIKNVGFLERLKYEAAKRIYSDSLPLRAICYTWGNRTPKESVVPMPYTHWFSQIVLENAHSPLNEWITEERDVYEDYRKAFGEEPGEVTGVAIMTNTDNLGGQATAWYGDITFRGKR